MQAEEGERSLACHSDDKAFSIDYMYLQIQKKTKASIFIAGGVRPGGAGSKKYNLGRGV